MMSRSVSLRLERRAASMRCWAWERRPTASSLPNKVNPQKAGNWIIRTISAGIPQTVYSEALNDGLLRALADGCIMRLCFFGRLQHPLGDNMLIDNRYTHMEIGHKIFFGGISRLIVQPKCFSAICQCPARS